MRIIQGKYKYRSLKETKRLTFSPISSAIRVNIFNVLENHLIWKKTKICDLFAGSGILGLEALSRGGKFCYFNEINIRNCKILEKNLEKFNISAKEAIVFQTSYEQFLAQLKEKNEKLDLIFIDPPYQKSEFIEKAQEFLIKEKLLKINAWLIIRSEEKYNEKNQKWEKKLKHWKSKKYGKHYIHFYQYQNKKKEMISNFNGEKLIIISGPSGVGKKKIIKNLLNAKVLNLSYSISLTTRKPRVNEENGKDYFFVSKMEFQQEIKANNFIEYAQYVNEYYGTSKSYVERLIQQEKKVLLEIEVLGALEVKKKFPQATWIFLIPPTMEELKKRITKRGTESSEEIKKRIAKAKEEINLVKMENLCDHFVVNDQTKVATEEILKTLQKNI